MSRTAVSFRAQVIPIALSRDLLMVNPAFRTSLFRPKTQMRRALSGQTTTFLQRKQSFRAVFAHGLIFGSLRGFAATFNLFPPIIIITHIQEFGIPVGR